MSNGDQKNWNQWKTENNKLDLQQQLQKIVDCIANKRLGICKWDCWGKHKINIGQKKRTSANYDTRNRITDCYWSGKKNVQINKIQNIEGLEKWQILHHRLFHNFCVLSIVLLRISIHYLNWPLQISPAYPLNIITKAIEVRQEENKQDCFNQYSWTNAY